MRELEIAFVLTCGGFLALVALLLITVSIIGKAGGECRAHPSAPLECFAGETKYSREYTDQQLETLATDGYDMTRHELQKDQAIAEYIDQNRSDINRAADIRRHMDAGHEVKYSDKEFVWMVEADYNSRFKGK